MSLSDCSPRGWVSPPKSTVRLQANASPEPISNVALSVAEDTTVVLGLGLIFTYPIVALVLAILLLAAIWFFVPRMLRATWIKLWLCGRKLRLAPDEVPVTDLPDDLPSASRSAVEDHAGPGWRVEWSVPCISGNGPGYPRNRFGWLVSADGPAQMLYFVPRAHHRKPRALPPGAPSLARLEHKFLADVLVLGWPGDGTEARFLFDRGSRSLGQLVADRLSGRPAVLAA
jgi:hypothetical protein